MANQRLNIDIVARDKSKQAINNVQGSLQKLKQSVFNLRNAFIGLGAGVVIKGFVDAGIQIENLGVQLKALFGSAKEGERALKSVTDFARTTPFELKNIQQGITALATVRKQAEENGVSFEELLKITGNTATVLGGDFALASLQIQRSFSAGISSAELFRERGVKAMAGFKEGVSINAKESILGLRKSFGTGGEFGNLINDLSKTLFGTISNLKDAFFIFQVEVSKGFFGALKQNLGDLKSTVEDNKQNINEFAQIVGTGLSKAIQGTASVLMFLKNNMTAIIEVTKIFLALKLVTFFYNLSKSIQVATASMLLFNKATKKNLLIGGTAILISQLDKVWNLIKKIRGKDQKEEKPEEDRKNNDAELIKKFARMETLSEAINRNFKDLFTSFRDANNTVIKDMQSKLTTIGQIIGKSLSGGIKSFSDAFARSVILGEKLSDTFKNMAQQLGVKILSSLIEILARKSVELAIEKMITREKQKQFLLGKGGGADMGAVSLFSMARSFLGFAKGGAVSKGQPIVVGENGAELFVPNQTGQITQSARGTGGGQTTVNFNINTVDASGFEELLIRSRGTITQLINNAVNERGKESLI